MFELPLISSRSTNHRAAIKTLIAFEGKNGSKNQIDILKLTVSLVDSINQRKRSWSFVWLNYNRLSVFDLHVGKKNTGQKSGLWKVILTLIAPVSDDASVRPTKTDYQSISR
ncbi:hypothetical protein BADSM9389_32510 [Buttiauxella agrestis]|nr:hypothetical protein BADSM9389_32510 [Buttiauxella agrestis]